MSPNLILFVLLAIGVAYLAFRMVLTPASKATPEEARAAVDAGTAVIIDVREPDEWQEGTAAPAVLLPLSDLRGPRTSWKPFLEQHRDKKLFLYCRSGGRSGTAASILAAEGFATFNIGGFSDWTAKGLPTRRP